MNERLSTQTPVPETGGKFRFKVIVTNGEASGEIDLPPLDFDDLSIDLLSDGSLVIVNMQKPWTSKGKSDISGLIFDPASGGRTQFFAGPGVHQIGVDGKDRIWVSYFDWGVHGIFDLGAGEANPEVRMGPVLIGGAGLNCFDRTGALIWQHDQTERQINECAALNVADDATHFFFADDFDLGTVSGAFATSYCKINLKNSHRFAISPTRVLFIGGHRSSLGAAYLFSLDAAGAVGPQKCSLMAPGGQILKRGRAVGRGSRLHLFTRTDWYSVDLADI